MLYTLYKHSSSAVLFLLQIYAKLQQYLQIVNKTLCRVLRDHSKKRVVDYGRVISIATTVITANQSNHVMGAMLERQGPRASL